MNQVSCILAAPDLLCEPALVQAAPASGIRVLRRSLDAADLLAAAAVDTSVPVVLSAGLPRLTPDCIARLQLQGRRVIGIAAESTDTDRIRQWGITSVIEISGVQATVSALALALSASVQEPRAATQPGVWATREPVTPAPMVPVPLRVTGTPPGEMQQKRGQVIAVWGPSGSPGRTTTALVMAGALAACGQRVLVVDGDTTAPSVTFLMGIVEDASGLVVATRYASQGRLTSAILMTLARATSAGFAILGGIGHPERWHELHPAAFAAVTETARQSFDSIIVDVGSGIERMHSSSDILGVDRYAIATHAIEHAEHVVAVGRADDLGLARLLNELPSLQQITTHVSCIAISSSIDAVAARRAVRTLQGYGVTERVIDLPRFEAVDVQQHHASRRGQRRFFRRNTGISELISTVEDQGHAQSAS